MEKLDDMKLTVLYIEYRNFFIDVLSRFYGFEKYDIYHYSEILNVDELCRNEALNWDMYLIEFWGKEKINWEYLSGNKCLSWTADLFDKYYDYWEWEYETINQCDNEDKDLGNIKFDVILKAEYRTKQQVLPRSGDI